MFWIYKKYFLGEGLVDLNGDWFDGEVATHNYKCQNNLLTPKKEENVDF